MASKQLTERRIIAAKPQAKEYMVSDGDGLFLRVRPSGSKTWFFKATVRGKEVKKTLGKYPDITLAQARELSLGVRDYRGDDAPKTVGELYGRWFNDYILINRKKTDTVRYLFDKHVVPGLGWMYLFDVSRGDVLKFLDGVAKQTPGTARNLASMLGQMFSYAYKREWLHRLPTYGITKKDVGIKTTTKRRFLKSEEIPMLFQQIREKRPFPTSTHLKIWLALATMTRLREFGHMRFEEIDFERGIWTIPEERSKNGSAHEVHLNSMAKHLLSGGSGKGFVFPGLKQGACLSARMMTADIRLAFDRGDLVLPGGSFTPHDLRRTGATMLGEMGVDSKLIELCLNHVEKNVVVSTYQRQVRLSDRRKAFDQLGSKLIGLLGGVDQLPTLASLDSAKRRASRSGAPG